MGHGEPTKEGFLPCRVFVPRKGTARTRIPKQELCLVKFRWRGLGDIQGCLVSGEMDE